VEADVYIWRFALLVVHARKEEEEEAKRLAWGKRLRNGLFCVECDVRPQLSQLGGAPVLPGGCFRGVPTAVWPFMIIL